MIVNDQIRRLGESLKGRLDSSLVDDALEYINYSENVLAFETLCDHIGDFDITITEYEYNQVLNIVSELNLTLSNRYLYIKPKSS